MSEYFRRRLLQSKLEREICFLKECIKVGIAELVSEIVKIFQVMDFGGITQEKNAVIFLQCFEHSDVRSGDVEEQCIPGGIDLFIRNGFGEQRLKPVAELLRSDSARFDTLEESGGIGDGTAGVKICQPQIQERFFGEFNIDVADDTAEVEDEVFDCVTGDA